MWTAHILTSGGALANFITAPQFTISFCTNGVLFMTDAASLFICREDLYRYTLPPRAAGAPGPRPITFSVVGGHTRRVLDIGPAGVAITATEAGGVGKLRSTALGGEAGEGILCDADALLSAGAQQPRPASDFLLRALKYIEAMDLGWRPKYEAPVLAGARNMAETLNIELVAGNGSIGVSIGGAPQGGADWGGPDAQFSGTVQLSRLRELAKLAGGAVIIGAVPPLGDFPVIWYGRASGAGRVLVVL